MAKYELDARNRVNLSVHTRGAQRVFLAGDFNGWNPTATEMTSLGGGLFEGMTPPLLRAPFTPVWVRYKFVIDGEWYLDPTNPETIGGDSALKIPPRQLFWPEQEGTVVDGGYYSPILGRALAYAAYLPPGYVRGGRRHPVLYLLHGYRDGGHTDWVVKGQIQTLMDTLIALKRVPPFIVIMPEANDSWYADSADGTTLWEQALVRDLLLHVDTTFRTRANRKGRVISGISMGGYGAIKLALQYPQLFVGAHSHSGFFDVLGDFRPEVFGEGETSLGHRQWNSPTWLVREQPERAEQLHLSFDCGEQDYLWPANVAFQELLTNLSVRHTFRSAAGYHSWDVVQYLAPAAMEGLGRALVTPVRPRRMGP